MQQQYQHLIGPLEYYHFTAKMMHCGFSKVRHFRCNQFRNHTPLPEFNPQIVNTTFYEFIIYWKLIIFQSSCQNCVISIVFPIAEILQFWQDKGYVQQASLILGRFAFYDMI